MKALPFYLSTFLLFILTGCIEEYEADIDAEDSNLLVVEGTICSGKLNKFYLSRTLPLHNYYDFYNTYMSYSPYPSNLPYVPYMPGIAGARVSVRGSDGSEYMAQWDNDCYACWIDALDPDVDYYLHIEVGDEVYESEPQKPLRTEAIAEIVAVQNTPESNIDVLVTPAALFEPDRVNYYSWTCDETWEVHSDYTTVVYYDTVQQKAVIDRNQFPHRGWIDAPAQTITVGTSSNYEGQHINRLKIYDIDRGDERVYYRWSGLVQQRAITKAEYEYERARLQAGTEMGGLFTPQPSALPTNIHCLTSSKHVIGYVGCSMNTSERRFFIDADDYSIYNPIREDLRMWVEDPSPEWCKLLVNRGMFLCEWIDERMNPNGTLRTAWAFPHLLDVRSKGAYIDEPDFWTQTNNDE